MLNFIKKIIKHSISKSLNHLQIYWSQETPEFPLVGFQQMLTAVFQGMSPELGVSFPHTPAEEIQSISLEVLESDLLHGFLQAVFIEGSRTKINVSYIHWSNLI